jgi:hypothetical protein
VLKGGVDERDQSDQQDRSDPRAHPQDKEDQTGKLERRMVKRAASSGGNNHWVDRA